MFKNKQLISTKMVLPVKDQGGYPSPETTLKNKAKHEVILIKRTFKSIFKTLKK